MFSKVKEFVYCGYTCNLAPTSVQKTVTWCIYCINISGTMIVFMFCISLSGQMAGHMRTSEHSMVSIHFILVSFAEHTC